MNPSCPLNIFCCPFLNFLQFFGACLAATCLDWGAIFYLRLPCLLLSAPCPRVLNSPAGDSVVQPSAALEKRSSSQKSASAALMVLELSLLYGVWQKQRNTDAASPEKAAALLRCVPEALHFYIRYKSDCFVTESTCMSSRQMEAVIACQNVVLWKKNIKKLRITAWCSAYSQPKWNPS